MKIASINSNLNHRNLNRSNLNHYKQNNLVSFKANHLKNIFAKKENKQSILQSAGPIGWASRLFEYLKDNHAQSKNKGDGILSQGINIEGNNLIGEDTIIGRDIVNNSTNSGEISKLINKAYNVGDSLFEVINDADDAGKFAGEMAELADNAGKFAGKMAESADDAGKFAGEMADYAKKEGKILEQTIENAKQIKRGLEGSIESANEAVSLSKKSIGEASAKALAAAKDKIKETANNAESSAKEAIETAKNQALSEIKQAKETAAETLQNTGNKKIAGIIAATAAIASAATGVVIYNIEKNKDK